VPRPLFAFKRLVRDRSDIRKPAAGGLFAPRLEISESAGMPGGKLMRQ
jgi:hypothetical protein